jgi:hypothetical protein
MDLTGFVNVFCAFSAIIQGVAALLYISEWQSKSKSSKAQMAAGKKIFTVILGAGALAMAGFAVWLYDHPLKPIDRPVYVDRPTSCPACPVCPAIKTGPATAKSGNGGISVAHSGNGDTTTANPKK